MHPWPSRPWGHPEAGQQKFPSAGKKDAVNLDVLTGLFDRVGLRTNTTKTKAMVFLLGRIRTPLTAESYEARMDEEFRAEKTGRRVTCTICYASSAVGSLRSHLVTQHNVHQCFVIKDS